jgi:hypothetical protein
LNLVISYYVRVCCRPVRGYSASSVFEHVTDKQRTNLYPCPCGFLAHVHQGGETGIGKMAAEKVWVPPAGREAKGGILNRPRRQMSFLSFSDSCELAPLRVCELASILCVLFWVMPRMLGKFPESFRLG